MNKILQKKKRQNSQLHRQDTDESQTAVKPEDPNSEEQSRKQIYYTKKRTLLTQSASGQEIQNTNITLNEKVLGSSTKALKQNNDPKNNMRKPRTTSMNTDNPQN